MTTPNLGEFLPPPTKKEQAAQRAEAMHLLESEGYIVHKPRPPEEEVTTLDVTHLTSKDRLRLGIVACTHFGSKYQQLTALRDFCTYADRTARVDAFVHAGDLQDGPVKRHKNPHEVFKHDYDAMLDYAVDVLPRTRKPWHIIGGNHDGWWIDDGGPNLIKALCERRDDCTYLGQDLGYLRFKNTIIEVFHFDSGSAYAYSYKPQKHIESLDTRRKPHVSLIANFHKFCALYYRNVFTIQLPAFQAQTGWMARKSLVSEVAGVILDIGLHPKGLAPVTKIEAVYTYEPREKDWP
jgi:calcineurin-like phosphoesterase family protein